MQIDLISDKSPEAEITFKAAVSFGIGFQGRPMTLEPIVIFIRPDAFIPSYIADVLVFDIKIKIAESRRIAPESVRDDRSFPQRRRRGKGDIKKISGKFSRASRREVPGLHGIEFGVFPGPDPAFMPSDAELGFIDKEAFMFGMGYR
jgi:hypothetical protein